ncbi:hypothetical protein [uncultured Neglectibacter sp.]
MYIKFYKAQALLHFSEKRKKEKKKSGFSPLDEKNFVDRLG